ncbi:MAG TPA: endonuclease/exonuclease/phosphatase family protein [Gemmataceae bacterium]|jgi:endonuclease/exonuclease/phosphatase (EEP) superfamily protein YafD|nr:endonuclease/exonuclease/phosphatase family protein [Gemmataceae bacterium]
MTHHSRWHEAVGGHVKEKPSLLREQLWQWVQTARARLWHNPHRIGRDWRQRLSRATAVCQWLYVAVLVGLWLLVRLAADRWWPAIILLYGPRWMALLPQLILIPATVLLRRRLLWLVPIASLIAVGPWMGFCVPWPGTPAADGRGPAVRVLTCNVDGDALNPAQLADLVAESQPDVVALQEYSPKFQTAIFGKGPWSIRTDGELCVASRFPIVETKVLQNAAGWRTLGVRHELLTPHGSLFFVNLHLETPRKGLEPVLKSHLHCISELEANLAVRRQESEAARRLTDDVDSALLIAGDFNQPTGSAIYRQYWSQFTNAFTSAGFGFGYTKYTEGIWGGIRIDHVLGNPGWRCRRCWVGPDVGSDHRPLLADMEWTGGDP